jgi:DNA-binding NarL/FixJ family response regulator
MATKPTYTVLLVDDEDSFRGGIRRLSRLLQADMILNIVEAHDGSEAMDALHCQPVDCVLIDHNMPGGSGLEWTRRILERYPNMAVIMLTGAGNEKIAVEAMKAGASDYLMKGSIVPEELYRSIRGAAEKSAMRKTIEAQQRELLAAERQRVMIESLGAACHHLGQPATVLTGYLEVIKRKPQPPDTAAMLDECVKAAYAIGDILVRLQTIGEYRTEPYLPAVAGQTARDGDCILTI